MALVARVYDHDSTVTIERQQKKIILDPPYQADQQQYPGGDIIGKGRDVTILSFTDVVGYCVHSAEFGTGDVGNAWNNNNKVGPAGLKASLRTRVEDFSVTANAQFRNSPWDYGQFDPHPDVHGPDMPHTADGICLEGAGYSVYRVGLERIPGTALILREGQGGQGGPFGFYDSLSPVIEDVLVKYAINGIEVSIGDAKVGRLQISGIVDTALLWNSSGGHLTNSHIAGSNLGGVFNWPVKASQLYHEACRIGTTFNTNASGSVVFTLDIGPGTCWEKGVYIATNGVELHGVCGSARHTDLAHPDMVGVAIAPGIVHSIVSGQLLGDPKLDDDGNPLPQDGNGAVLFNAGGARNQFNQRGGWNKENPKNTFCRFVDHGYGSECKWFCSVNKGTILDMRLATGLRTDGKGFRAYLNYAGTPDVVVMWPAKGDGHDVHADDGLGDYSPTYSLGPNCHVEINGALQS